MDAFERLRDDHRRLRRLFADLIALPPRAGARRERLLGRLDRLFAVHSTVEEEVLYPALAAAGGAAAWFGDACEQHLLAQRELAALAALPDGDPRFADQVERLRDLVASHIDDEEAVLFPLVRRRLVQLARDALARRLDRRRSDALLLYGQTAPVGPR